MNWKKGLGIGLIFIGIYIIIINAAITGAVIGAEPKNLLGWLGVISFIFGIFLLLASRSLEAKVKRAEVVDAPAFFKRVEEKAEDGAFLILDTSAIRSYRLQELARYLEAYGREKVVVPGKVLDEIYSSDKREFRIGLRQTERKFLDLREVVEDNSSAEPEGFEQYREDAREYLERTDKPRLAEELRPYIDLAKRGQLEDLSPTQITRFQKLSRRMGRIIMEETGIRDPSAFKHLSNRLEIVEDYLDRLEVSETDVDVLATAMYMADHGYKALIAERDIDLRQAVEIIKVENPGMGRNMDIVEPYKQDYHITDRRLRDLGAALQKEKAYTV